MPPGRSALVLTISLLGAFLGIAYVFVLPPLQAPDEFAHFYRAYGVSEGHCVAPRALPLPQSVTDFTNTFMIHLEQGQRVTEHVILLATRRPLNETQRVPVTNEAINLYNCVPYLPAALGIKAGRIFAASPLVLLYLCRLFNLAAYLLAAAYCLRQLPDFKLPTLGIILMPMALHQAASASWDAVSFSSAFLLFAYVLKLAFGDKIVRLGARHYVILGSAVMVASLCKANIWLVGLTLLIPDDRFGSRPVRRLAVCALVALALITLGVWSLLNHDNLVIYKAQRISWRGIYFDENLRFICYHPILFFGALFRALQHEGWLYLRNFVGTFGWLAVILPNWFTVCYLAFLGFLTLTQTSFIRVSMQQRLCCVLAAAGGILFTFVALWAAETPQAYINESILKGTGHLAGMQGRYLIPFALPILLALSGGRCYFNRAWLLPVAAVVIAASNLIALDYIRDTYYATGDAEPSMGIAPAVYRAGAWIAPTRPLFRFGGQPGDTPVYGDWSGEGRTRGGTYHDGVWNLDTTQGTVSAVFGGLPGDIPVSGDWTGDGTSKLGIYRKGLWILDTNGNHRMDEQDRRFSFGGLSFDIPVFGDWTGDGKSKAGIYRQGLWVLDTNNNGFIDETGPQADVIFPYGGLPGDLPVAGDWAGTGKSMAGVYRRGIWMLDLDGKRTREVKGPYREKLLPFGLPNDIPVAGHW